MLSQPADAQAVFAALTRFHAGREHAYKMTPLGMWACSDASEVYDLYRQIQLERYAHLADLGSGDGRAVLLASLFTQATGIEADPELVQASQDMAQELGLTRASFILGDCRQADLSSYDLLFLYPDKPLTWLEQRLPAGWPGHLLVYGPYFRPESMTHVRTIYAGKTICGLWAR